MGVNFKDIAATVAPAQAAPARTKSDKTPAEVYGNVGFSVQLPNQETGELESTFISIPLGIGIDNQDPMEMKGSNPNWANMVQAKNALLDQLKTLAAGLAPGEEMVVDGIEFQLKRRGTVEAPAQGENPILSAMADRFKVVK